MRVEDIAAQYGVPTEKDCPECGGKMLLQTGVEPDEIPYEETGDFELATTYNVEFECGNCGFCETVHSETKGTGILR